MRVTLCDIETHNVPPSDPTKSVRADSSSNAPTDRLESLPKDRLRKTTGAEKFASVGRRMAAGADLASPADLASFLDFDDRAADERSWAASTAAARLRRC